MSELVIVALRQLSNVSVISWREQVNFQCDDDEVHFVLNQNALLVFLFIVLTH
jgi:DNA polymerase II large subunit